MKTIKRVLFFSSFFLLLTSSSCETNDIIQTGDESFSCYINGQLFIPKANVNLLEEEHGIKVNEFLFFY